MPRFDHFGMIAPFYDRVARGNQRQEWAQFLGFPYQGRLLDVGGGTGRAAQSLTCETCEVTVVDVSLKMLRLAAAKPGVKTVCSPAETLPFPSKSFERIIMVDALHHVADQRVTASELWRILKPGGRLLIEEPNIHRIAVKLIALAEKLLLMRSHFLSPRQIANLFEGMPARVTIHVRRADANAWILVERKDD